MSNEQPKKATTVVSLSFRSCVPIADPEPNGPRHEIKEHTIPLLVVSDVKELIDFLDLYTDFDNYYHGDFLDKKWTLKDRPVFVIDIMNWDLLKQNILCNSPYKPGWDYFYETYEEKRIKVHRLPIGVQKRHLNEDLFQL